MRMRMSRQTGRAETPLDVQQKALEQEEEKLRLQMERLQRWIERVPELAEQEEKKRREEIVRRASQSSRRVDAATLLDKRYDVNAGVQRPRRHLKAERQEARLKFMVLCVILAGFLIWLISLIQ
jgi:hypothetical protein